ncbi:MAG: hypothetical protein ACRERC_15665 [Candidatus Binatia bacterium]
MAVTAEEAAKGTRWGVDLDFTYGPAAALATRYFASNYYAVILPLLGLVSIAFGACFAGVVLHTRAPRAWPATVARVGVAAALTALLALAWTDAFFFSFSFLVFLSAMRAADLTAAGRALTVVGVIGLGAAGVSKVSYLLLSVALLIVADLYRAIDRRAPVLTIVCLASCVATFCIVGQQLADFPAFVAMGVDNVLWYSEAMSLVGYHSEVAVFALLCVVFVAAAGRLEWRRHATFRERARAVLLVGGVGLFCLMGFKEGFVRHDYHDLIGWYTLSGGIGLYAISLTPPLSARAFALCTMVSVIGLLLPPIRFGWRNGDPNALQNLARGQAFKLIARPMVEARRAVSFALNPASFIADIDAAKERAWATIRAESPLPALAGSVDIIPSRQSAVIAHGLAFRPRPAFQEYQTFKPRAIEANRRYFSSTARPEWLLFTPGSIDGRHPASAEGAQWPLFLRHYEPVGRVQRTLILRRRAESLPDLLGERQLVQARIGDQVAVPSVDAPQFVTISIRRSAIGSLLNLLYKAPPLHLRAEYRGGGSQTFRLIPAIAQSGAILVPTIEKPGQFARLAGGDASPPGSRRPISFEVVAGRFGRLAYAADVEFGFQAIDVAPMQAAAAKKHSLQAQ